MIPSSPPLYVPAVPPSAPPSAAQKAVRDAAAALQAAAQAAEQQSIPGHEALRTDAAVSARDPGVGARDGARAVSAPTLDLTA